jgi:hypothetical protein
MPQLLAAVGRCTLAMLRLWHRIKINPCELHNSNQKRTAFSLRERKVALA